MPRWSPDDPRSKQQISKSFPFQKKHCTQILLRHKRLFGRWLRAWVKPFGRLQYSRRDPMWKINANKNKTIQKNHLFLYLFLHFFAGAKIPAKSRNRQTICKNKCKNKYMYLFISSLCFFFFYLFWRGGSTVGEFYQPPEGLKAWDWSRIEDLDWSFRLS